MGMYTELLLKCEVATEDEQAKAVLQFLFNGGELPDTLPDHEFFRCTRWSQIGRCASFYHVPVATSCITDQGYLFSRSDMKNYDGEIAKFLDWARGHLIPACGDVAGWVWYEEDAVPTLIDAKGWAR